jgi:hypothetical protein
MREVPIVALLAAALAAATLASCGGETESTSPQQRSTQRQIEASIGAFLGGDAERTCVSLGRAALSRVGGAARCREKAAGRKAIAYRIDSVRVDGGSAVAVVRSAGRVIQFTLSRDNGAWLVTEPPPALPGVPSSVPR